MNHLIISIIFLVVFWGCNEKGSAKDTCVSDKSNTGVDVKFSACEKDLGGNNEILKRTIYIAADSVRVVNLLRKDCGKNDVLFYARQFKGLPYVASTLEVSEEEKLVVNLREMDCTTLVETVLALCMTKRQNSDKFADYCKNLMRLRYWDGEMNGYLSRLHYFTWWMHDNMKRGIVSEVTDKKYFTASIIVKNKYMSMHPEKYRFLKGNAVRIDSIAKLENKYNGPDGNYLPEKYIGLQRKELSMIKDGDLVAIVTRKNGLDYSHLGFAVWGKDGFLHLLNASSIHHRVVEEPKTLKKYLSEHPSSIGVRLFRLN